LSSEPEYTSGVSSLDLAPSLPPTMLVSSSTALSPRTRLIAGILEIVAEWEVVLSGDGCVSNK
jgi:hypothetical protein